MKKIVKVFLKIMSLIVDGSDNFETKFLINDYCLKSEKFLVTGAIRKFDGHIFTFDFKKKYCMFKNFFQEDDISDDILNCEYEGVLGSVAGVSCRSYAIQ